MTQQQRQRQREQQQEVTLPLRLAAEPYAKSLLSPSCVCLRASHDDLAILVDDRGIVGLAIDQAGSDSTSGSSGSLASRQEVLDLVPAEVRPSFEAVQKLFVLIRQRELQLSQWHVLHKDKQQLEPLPVGSNASNAGSSASASDTASANPVPVPIHSASAAEWITTSIRHYYAQQILEPSVRGFLSVLEKQFSQANLYLFELLQNAVDDGATVVQVHLQQGKEQGLQFTHNGRPLTPLDVLGLSSVGLSTKSSGQQRTIGFMGIGFKAVYKRYAQVTIDDGHYAFQYQEPTNNDKGYGWVMLPLWQTPTYVKQHGIRFSLQRPRGGYQALAKDLAVLPKTAPPLLGRAALLRQLPIVGKEKDDDKKHCWTLDWNGKVHKIQRTQLQHYNDNDMSEILTVQITQPNDGATITNRWLFLTHEYTPTADANESYHKHTKRRHVGKEQVCGFIPLLQATNNTDDTKLATNFSGVVHSVLPTKIKLPIPLHLQASFLLSVDRQQVQDLSDNQWNANILHKLPNVIAIAFRWAAKQQMTDYSGILQLLQNLPLIMNNTTACSQILNQSISLQSLQQALYTEPILPVAMPEGNSASTSNTTNTTTITTTSYYEGRNSIWVPPIFCKLLNPDFLRGWLGKRPLRTDSFLGKNSDQRQQQQQTEEGAYHPLFRLPQVVQQLTDFLASSNGIVNRKRLTDELQLSPRNEVTTKALELLLRLLGAIGIAYQEQPTNTEAGSVASNGKSKDAKNNTTTTITTFAQPILPSSINVWSVFLNEQGALATIDQIVLPSEDLSSLPNEMFLLLRPYFIKKDSHNNGSHRDSQTKKGGRFQQQKRRKMNPRQELKVQRLHPQLERALCAFETGRTPEELSGGLHLDEIASGASSFLTKVRSEHPKNVVDVATAVARLLEDYSTLQTLSEANIETLVSMAKFALESNNHQLFPYVLVDHHTGTTTRTKLVLAPKAYIGHALDMTGSGADLETFAGKKLDFVSTAYSTILKSKLSQRKFTDLMALAGVQTGLAVTITAILDVEKERKVLAEEILPKLPNHKLPQLRKNSPKSDIVLPYGLGAVMNRRKYSLLDSELALEWEQLIRNMNPTSAKGFIALLLAIPMEDTHDVTGKTVPAASMCLSGQGATATGTGASTPTATPGNRSSVRVPNETTVPIRRRLYFLPPGQPGAKALDISEAKLVTQLKSLKWLPCSAESDPELVLLSPKEALLEADNSRPEMPVVQLPAVIKRRLKETSLAKHLTFGTVAPPPPVTELGALSKEVGVLMSASDIDKGRVSSLSNKMVSIWSSIARSHLRDGLLSSTDMRELRVLCQNGYCIPVRHALDGPSDSNWVVQTSRCVRMSKTLGSRASHDEELKYQTIASLVASNFMFDFHHSLHNPFFSQPNISLAIQTLAGITDVSSFQPKNLIRACGLFLRYCCAAEPVLPNRASPLRDAFSFAMKWCLESPNEFPKMNGGVKVWVRSGPGVGPKARRRRWVSIEGGDVQPVLDDNRVRSALLSPEMGIQLLGVLNHAENEKDCSNPRLLEQIDSEIIQYFGIWRLSDKRFSVKTKAKGSGEVVDNASHRLQLVCALLKSMVMEHNNATGENAQGKTTTTEDNSFLHTKFVPPLIIRHESLTREFIGPGMETQFSVYAVFGRAKKFTQDRCILVAGDPDDYCIELQELVVQHVGARTSGPFSQSKEWRAAVRLLSHLENEASFMKFVKRDFDDFEVVQAWRKLSNRILVLGKLKKAEAAKELSVLRETLILAEEVFDDDPDGGDAILQSARELLRELEEEAEANRLKGRERALEDLKEATRIGDRTKLRISLLLAEKVCKDDPDKGHSILVDARERLRCVEQEYKETIVKEEPPEADSDTPTAHPLSHEEDMGVGRGRGRGRTLPAWMTSTDGPKSAGETPGSVEISSATIKQEDQPSIGEPGSVVTAAVDATMAGEGMGRGRGRTLPAWITSTDGPRPVNNDKPADESKQSIQDLAISNGSEQPALMMDPSLLDQAHGTGRGRGRTLPAWMTSSGDGPKQIALEDPTREPRQTKPPDETVHETSVDSAAKSEAKNILSTILQSGDTLSPRNAAEVAAGASVADKGILGLGRGRGAARTLPAWMTSHPDSSVGPKRSRSPITGEDLDGAHGHNKKSRGDNGGVPFEYSLRVTMDPAREADFVRWLEPALQSEAQALGGSATLTKSPSRRFED